LVDHYNKWGKTEGRITSQKQLDELIASTGQPDFDVEFYRTYYTDLSKFHVRKLFDHYNKWGKNEGRIFCDKQLNQQQMDELIESISQPDFDVYFYRSYYKDLSHMTVFQSINHYNTIGRNEGRVCAKKFLDVENYKKNIITCMQLQEVELINHIQQINSELLDKIEKNINKFITKYDKITSPYINKLYLSWFTDSIINKKISIVSPISNKIIYTDKYFITNSYYTEKTVFSVCNYYFDDEEIILGLGLGTGNHPQETHILYVYCINENKLFYDWINYSLENFKNNLLKKINIYATEIKNHDFDIMKSKVTTTYGFMANMGHMLFNDYTGLYLIEYHNLYKNIDEILFGPHDVYKIKNYFQQFDNITIKEMNTISDIEIIGKGVFFKFNHFYILNDTISFLKRNLLGIFTKNIDQKNDYDNVTNSAEIIKKKHYPIFNIVLRKGDFEMNNQVSVMSNLINLLIQKYPNAFFYLDGFVQNTNEANRDEYINIGINHNLNISKITLDYLELSNEIIKNINTTNCMSLINTNILYLITHIQNCNYGIYVLGSGACNAGWICQIPGIQFGREHIKIYENMDKTIREDFPSIIYLENNIRYNKDGTFDVSAQTIFDCVPEL
jgi:hypothetical protein